MIKPAGSTSIPNTAPAPQEWSPTVFDPNQLDLVEWLELQAAQSATAPR